MRKSDAISATLTRRLSMSDAAQLLDELRHGRLVALEWAREAQRDSEAFQALPYLDHQILTATDAVSGQDGFLQDQTDGPPKA